MDSPPSIYLESYQLEAVHEFTYPKSLISDTLSLDTELSHRIGKASIILARLTKRVWKNNRQTEMSSLAWPCTLHGRWQNPQSPSLQRAHLREKTNRLATPNIQIHL